MGLRIFFLVILTILANFEVRANGGSCIYEVSEHTGYGCTLSFDNPRSKSNFTFIEGSHLEGKTDDDVLGVWIYMDIPNIDVAPYVCSKFNNLERLFLRRLVVTELPENSFSSCKNLNSLILKTDKFSNSHITELPQNLLAENTKLTNFEASLKDLRAVPETFFANNPNLTSVTIRDSRIRTLPSNLFKPLVNLGGLYLSMNDIQSINPAWFASLENLHVLYLNDNHITDIPKNTFTHLKNLSELWISYNHLTVIHSDSFGEHPDLKHINLMYNNIKAIDEKFIDNIGVKYLEFLRNGCASGQFYNKDGDKGDLKESLKKCFENYQPWVDVGERVDIEEPETTTPATSLFDKVDGEELLKNFLTLFNQMKNLQTTQSTLSDD